MKLLESSKFFDAKKIIINWVAIKTPNSKNIIATLRIVTIEKSELTFLLILYFRGCIFCLTGFLFHTIFVSKKFSVL